MFMVDLKVGFYLFKDVITFQQGTRVDKYWYAEMCYTAGAWVKIKGMLAPKKAL